jgi:hypothetical protein
MMITVKKVRRALLDAASSCPPSIAQRAKASAGRAMRGRMAAATRSNGRRSMKKMGRRPNRSIQINSGLPKDLPGRDRLYW